MMDFKVIKTRVTPQSRELHFDWNMRIDGGTITLSRKTTDEEKAEYQFNEAMKVLNNDR